MHPDGKVNILLVDDQPAKLMSYTAILGEMGENLINASSGREALEHLLKSDIAVVLMDVCMPELDGFQLAAMIREHPRFGKTAIIFISAIHLTDVDRLRGYEMGAVDYVPVPVIPEVLRAKVKVFAELYRKTRQLEALNAELERRVAERTAELERSTKRLRESEERRNLALAAGQMGSWDWDIANGDYMLDEGQKQIFGVDPESFVVTPARVIRLIHPADWKELRRIFGKDVWDGDSCNVEFRVRRPDGELRWCAGTAVVSVDASGRISRVSGVTIDITDRKEAEERQLLLAREVDHRAKNALAVVQSIVHLTRSDNIKQFVAAVEGRIQALARAHSLLSESRWRGANIATLVQEELAPYRTSDLERVKISGRDVSLDPPAAQALALALHELATNASKYGALSSPSGSVQVFWESTGAGLELRWIERGGPKVETPVASGFGMRVIKASIGSQLGGNVEFDWRRDGLHCAFRIPCQARLGASEDASALNWRTASSVAVRVGGRRRVLLLEDEIMISMMMAQTLSELGFEVVGPFANVASAVAAIEAGGIDAAILDVNLGTESGYSVAPVLQARRVPFIFMTGYGVESVSTQFPNAPIVQKPVAREMLQELLGTSIPQSDVFRDAFVRAAVKTAVVSG
jgi:PAS domain S-box-containing protein